LTLSDQITVNTNDQLADPELRREAGLLPQVAALAAKGIAGFFIDIETQIEVCGLPDLDSETGMFCGARHTVVDAPVQYGRVIFSGSTDFKEEQFNFLCSLRQGSVRSFPLAPSRG
jgi:hypothetical protein